MTPRSCMHASSPLLARASVSRCPGDLGWQDAATPTRRYRLTPLRQIFRTRSALPGPLHKTFMRLTEPDVDDMS